jgi:signal transduction histidine kinase
MISLAEAACELPWLAPCADSLVALTRPPQARSWHQLRGDPGLVLLLLRQRPPAEATSALSFYPALLHDPGVLALALDCLTAEDCFVDWGRPELFGVYRAALAYARAAEALALHTDRCDPDHAWVGGLLAPLGCLAMAPREPIPADDAESAARWQQQVWGLDQSAIARRLAARWRLPAWLAAVVGHLGLPLDVARTLGADPELFLTVQLAVTLVDQAGRGLNLLVGGARESLAAALDLAPDALPEIDDSIPVEVATRAWQSPAAVPLLPDLLRLALDNRRQTGSAVQQRLHAQLDALHESVRRQHAAEEARLHERKLRALAELAAGAGHEINNPLAVISGQAQYLLVAEHEPARRKALTTIVGQTQRIHQTLTQLMQFARPQPPQLQRVDLGGLLRDAASAVQALADERQVRLTLTEPAPLTLLVDPAQIRAALVALVRNAVEAAPASGWASLLADGDAARGLTLIVEDSGPGPSEADREHLFDPFYSGRKAGRGRGLGLPTAWRLARQHGGDVRFDGFAPTRFVFTLPPESVAAPEPAARAS